MTTLAYSYIRFSTPEQMDGDSLRRQLEDSIGYAAERGLVLDNKLNMRDLGVSAFRGANVEKGRLGAFIKAVEDGLVPRGSFLLVESLDRLSRAEVLDALQIFTTIVNLGITIVTLMDEREYSRESLSGMGSMDLVFSLIIMSRAYEESATKSKRRRKTWNQSKRVAATDGEKMTRKLPFWLSLPDPDDDFVVDPEAAAVVRRVFELARAGYGYWKICQTLNAEGVRSPAARNYTKKPKYDEPRTWATSSIGHLLKNEAVIGNLVMGEATLEKNEAPVPNRIDGYYPPIIDDELFYAVLGKRQAPKGRSSLLKTNLFTGLLYCGYCHGPMQVDSNTKNEKRRSRICCQRKRRSKSCDCKNWSYDEFEEEFFTFVGEVDIGSIVEPQADNAALAGEVAELEGRLTKANEMLTRLLRVIEEDDDAPLASIKTRIREREAERILLESELRIKQVQLEAERNYTARAEREISAIRHQFTTLRGMPPDERLVVRYSIAEHIAAIVHSVHLYPNGSDIQLVDPHTDELRQPDPEPYFRVEFRNGLTGLVKPRRELSARFDLSKKPA